MGHFLFVATVGNWPTHRCNSLFFLHCTPFLTPEVVHLAADWQQHFAIIIVFSVDRGEAELRVWVLELYQI